MAVEADDFASRLSQHAQAWGAVWQAIDDSSGDLDLPVVAGIRRGFRRYRLSWQGIPLVLRASLSEEQLEVQRGSVMLLIVGGLGGLASVLWPLYPGILAVVPLGLVLAVGAWILVVARLRSSGLEEFLDELEKSASGNEPAADDVVS